MRYLNLEVPTSDGTAALQAVSASVAGLRNVVAAHTAPAQVTVTETWRPYWTFLVAVLLFPVGLLALLHKRQSRLVVTANGSVAQIAGVGHEHVCDPVLAALHSPGSAIAAVS